MYKNTKISKEEDEILRNLVKKNLKEQNTNSKISKSVKNVQGERNWDKKDQDVCAQAMALASSIGMQSDGNDMALNRIGLEITGRLSGWNMEIARECFTKSYVKKVSNDLKYYEDLVDLTSAYLKTFIAQKGRLISHGDRVNQALWDTNFTEDVPEPFEEVIKSFFSLYRQENFSKFRTTSPLAGKLPSHPLANYTHRVISEKHKENFTGNSLKNAWLSDMKENFEKLTKKSSAGQQIVATPEDYMNVWRTLSVSGANDSFFGSAFAGHNNSWTLTRGVSTTDIVSEQIARNLSVWASKAQSNWDVFALLCYTFVYQNILLNNSSQSGGILGIDREKSYIYASNLIESRYSLRQQKAEKEKIKKSASEIEKMIKEEESDAGVSDPPSVPGDLPAGVEYTTQDGIKIKQDPRAVGAPSGKEPFFPSGENEINFEKFFEDLKERVLSFYFKKPGFISAYRTFSAILSVSPANDTITFAQMNNCFSDFKKVKSSSKNLESDLEQSDKDSQMNEFADFMAFFIVTTPESYLVSEALPFILGTISNARQGIFGVQAGIAAGRSFGIYGFIIGFALVLWFYFSDPLNKIQRENILKKIRSTKNKLKIAVKESTRDPGAFEREKAKNTVSKFKNYVEDNVEWDSWVQEFENYINRGQNTGKVRKWKLSKEKTDEIMQDYFSALESFSDELKSSIEINWRRKSQNFKSECETLSARLTQLEVINNYNLLVKTQLGLLNNKEVIIDHKNWPELLKVLEGVEESIGVLFDSMKSPDTFIIVNEQQQNKKEKNNILIEYINKNIKSLKLSEQKATTVDDLKKFYNKVEWKKILTDSTDAAHKSSLGAAVDTFFIAFDPEPKATRFGPNPKLSTANLQTFTNRILQKELSFLDKEYNSIFQRNLIQNFNNIKSNIVLSSKSFGSKKNNYKGALLYNSSLRNNFYLPAAFGVDHLFSKSNMWGTVFLDLKGETSNYQGNFSKFFEQHTGVSDLNIGGPTIISQLDSGGNKLPFVWCGPKKYGKKVDNNFPNTTFKNLLTRVGALSISSANINTAIAAFEKEKNIINTQLAGVRKGTSKAPKSTERKAFSQFAIEFLRLIKSYSGVLQDFKSEYAKLNNIFVNKSADIPEASVLRAFKESGITTKMQSSAKGLKDNEIKKAYNTLQKKLTMLNNSDRMESISDVSSLMAKVLFHYDKLLDFDSAIGDITE